MKQKDDIILQQIAEEVINVEQSLYVSMAYGREYIPLYEYVVIKSKLAVVTNVEEDRVTFKYALAGGKLSDPITSTLKVHQFLGDMGSPSKGKR